jgi:CHAT domain-containing protein
MNHHQSSSAIPAARGIRWLSATFVILALGLWAQTADAASAEPEALQVRVQQATRAFSLGHFADAVQGWDEAAAAYAESGDTKGQIRALLGKGNAYLALGRHSDAVFALEDAHARAKEVADPELVALTNASLGNGYLLTGRADEAGNLLGVAITDARAHGRWDIAARAGNDQGSRLASMGRFDIAIETYQEALQDAERADGRLTVAKTRVNLARALQSAARPDKAREELFQVLTELVTLPNSHDQAYALISAGRLFATATKGEPANPGDKLLANQAFEAGAVSAEVIDDRRALSYALGYQAELYEQAGRTEDALLLARQATFAAQRASAPEILYRWQWAVGRLLAEQGEIDPAIESYERAVYTLNAIRPDLVGGYRAGQKSFREEVGPLFLELADLELQQAVAESDPAAREASLLRVRDTVEALKGVELADYFQDDCVAALKSKTVGIDQLADRTAAIYPIIFDDRIELLVSLPSGTKLYTTRVPSQDVEKVVRGFRGTLERRITHQYRRPARQVYDWLIRPLSADLDAENIDTLVIVPDGVLRLIPMAALHDGERYLVEQYAIATSPGLTLTDPTPIERKNIRVLMTGLTESVQGFPALPNVEQELKSINALYQGTVLQNETFVSQNVQSELQKTSFSIVHIATHGEFSRNAGESYVLTYDGRLDMDDLERYMSMTTFREQPIELLTLSACQTATGDDRAALGLAGIAVKAGARSALATLWFINDQASAVLIAEFYAQLQDPSLSKVKALQQAQLKLLEDRRYRHPIYWSPFLLIGNWL